MVVQRILCLKDPDLLVTAFVCLVGFNGVNSFNLYRQVFCPSLDHDNSDDEEEKEQNQQEVKTDNHVGCQRRTEYSIAYL